MFLATAVSAAESGGGINFDPFDIFIILFTILAVFAVIRSVQHKNKFAAGFSMVVLLVFLFTDVVMVLNWFDVLDDVLVALKLA